MNSTIAPERSSQTAFTETPAPAVTVAEEVSSKELVADRSDLELLHLAFNLGTPLDNTIEQEIVTLPAEESAQAAPVVATREDMNSPSSLAYDIQPPRFLMGDLPSASPAPTKPTAPTRLPAGWTFTGSIVSKADVDVACRIDGSITCENPKSRLLLRAESTTVGDVVACDVTVEGTHTGRIDASNGNVSLSKTSKVNGEVRYTTIQMQGGAHRMQLQYVEPTNA